MVINMGSIIMVASGKDGIGKSTVSVFIGAALASKGHSTLVIELDSGYRSIDIIAAATTSTVFNVHDVLSEKCDVNQAIVESSITRGLFVMSAPFIPAIMPIGRFSNILKNLAQQFEFVIIDTAPNNQAIIAAAELATSAIVVVRPDPSSIRDAHNVADKLFDLRVSDVRMVINHLIPERIIKGIIPNLDYVIDVVGLRILGVVPELDEIAIAAAGISQLNPQGLGAAVFSNIAERILGREVPLIVR